MNIDPISISSLVQNTTNVQNNNSNSDAVSSFKDILDNVLNSANDSQINAEEETQKLINGDAKSIDTVMIAASEAQLNLELAAQIRNKIVDAYQEINRMQI